MSVRHQARAAFRPPPVISPSSDTHRSRRLLGSNLRRGPHRAATNRRLVRVISVDSSDAPPRPLFTQLQTYRCVALSDVTAISGHSQIKSCKQKDRRRDRLSEI